MVEGKIIIAAVSAYVNYVWMKRPWGMTCNGIAW